MEWLVSRNYFYTDRNCSNAAHFKHLGRTLTLRRGSGAVPGTGVVDPPPRESPRQPHFGRADFPGCPAVGRDLRLLDEVSIFFSPFLADDSFIFFFIRTVTLLLRQISNSRKSQIPHKRRLASVAVPFPVDMACTFLSPAPGNQA